MKFRYHREFLDESMKTVVEIEPTLTALHKEISSKSIAYGDINKESIKVEPYGSGYDKRIGWNTHVVTIDGDAMGFTDGPLEG